MILKEFFGKPLNISQQKEKSTDMDKDELFFFILEDDEIYKKYFFPVARHIKNNHNSADFDRKSCLTKFLPFVNEGCKKYYMEKKMSGHITDKFPKELRDELCERIFEHFYEDIVKEKYNLGQ